MSTPPPAADRTPRARPAALRSGRAARTVAATVAPLALAALALLPLATPTARAQEAAPTLPAELLVTVAGRSARPLPLLSRDGDRWSGRLALRFDGAAPDPSSLDAGIVTPQGLGLPIEPVRDGATLILPWFGAMTPAELAGGWRIRLGDDGFTVALAPLGDAALLAFAPAPSLATAGLSAVSVALVEPTAGPLRLARAMEGMTHSSDDELLELRPGAEPTPLRFAMVGGWTLRATLPDGAVMTATLDVLAE